MNYQTVLKFIVISALTVFGRPSAGEILSELGKTEIREGMKGARPVWSRNQFFNLSKVWGTSIEPTSEQFKQEIQKRYGLFYDKNFPNDGLPVGLTQTAASISSGLKGITVSCQSCHSSSLFGRASDAISNVFFDYSRLFSDMQTSGGFPSKPFFESNPDRNSMVSYSNYMGRLGIFVRNPFPYLDLYRLYAVFADPNPDNAIVQPLKKELPYRELVKTQPWLGYKYKVASGSGLYTDGGYSGSPSATHYAIHFTLDPAGLDFFAAVQSFDRVGPAYLSVLEAPKLELNRLDSAKISRGLVVYGNKCASCHGTFQQDEGGQFSLTNYPGKLVDREIVKTDTLRVDYRINYESEVPEFVKKLYKKTYKYIAPPLTGIWARAPYFHNGSVPTLMQVLNSKTRMKKFGIQPNTDSIENFDKSNVGWVTTDLSTYDSTSIKALKNQDPYIRIFDSTENLGMSNKGHTFGDSLSEKDRTDLLEFLKAI